MQRCRRQRRKLESTTVVALAFVSILSCPQLIAQEASHGSASPRHAGIPVGGRVQAAVTERNRVYVAAGRAGFRIIDLALGKVIRTTPLPGESAHSLAIHDGRAFVLSKGEKSNHLREIYLKDGSIASSRRVGTGGPAGVAIVGRRQVVALGARVLIFEDGRARPMAEIRLESGVVRDLCVSGKKVLLARSYPGGLGIIDVEKGKLERMVETTAWLTRVAALPGAAFGLGMGKLTRIDLETKKVAPVLVTAGPIAATRSGWLCLQHRDELVLLDSNGKRRRTILLPDNLRDAGARLSGCGRRSALLIVKDRLFVLRLPARRII